MAISPVPKIVIVGSGFGGLFAARNLVGKPVEILLIDRQNFHTFTPLLYQVASCALDASEIAYPIRSILYNQRNLRFVMGEVTAIDYDQKSLTVVSNEQHINEAYDYLILATGSETNYFGNTALAENAFSLKDLEDAIIVRNHILRCFEKAIWATDADQRAALTTIVVVGGGPTGLETVGSFSELYNDVLKKEYPSLNRARVILVEAVDRLLTPYPASLQRSAYNQVSSLGVEIILNSPVDEVTEGNVRLKNGRNIPSYTLIWAAGVKASAVGALLGVPLERAGRVPVRPTLEAIGRDCIYVIGDLAHLPDKTGTPYPMLIPVAKQQGRLATYNILQHINRQPQVAFQYHDRGIMATIGRRRAVAWIYNRIPLTGFIAWIAWLFLHLIWLLGFRNRVTVFIKWVWSYFTYDRSVRLILRPERYQKFLKLPETTPD